MGYLDVANIVKRQFSPQVVTTFAKQDALLSKIIENGKVIRAKGGNSREMPMVWRTGVTGREIGQSGLTPMSRTSEDVTKMMKTSPVALGFDLMLPITILDKLQGDGAIANYAQMRLKNAYAGAFQDISAHFLRGGTDGKVFAAGQLRNLATLNGEHNTGTLDGMINGLLDFRTPAQQTSDAEVVQNLAKSEEYDHFNQHHALGTGWSTDGRRQMRSMYRKCHQRDSLYSKGPDMAWCSSDTADNIIADNFTNTRVTSASDNGETLGGTFLIDFGGMMLSPSEFIDPANHYTDSDAQGGVLIMLNSRYLELWTLLKAVLDSKPFSEDISGAQRALVSRFSFHGNMMLGNLAAHGVLTNTD